MSTSRVNRIRRGSVRWVVLLSVLALAGASCGSDDAADGDAHETEDHSEGYEFGEPMDPADATRVIEIEARDDFTFAPDGVSVAVGETVTFRVENVGVIPHDFTIGDSHLQEEHEAEMAEMSADMMAAHEEPNAVSLAPGDVKEMTWHFTEPGEIIFGCHTPGHYPAGMRGSLTIEA